MHGCDFITLAKYIIRVDGVDVRNIYPIRLSKIIVFITLFAMFTFDDPKGK